MKLAGRPAALILAAALAAACSNDSTGPRGSLTSDELRELARQVGIHLAAGLSGSAASFSKGGAALSSIPLPLDISFRVTVPCPVEGTTRVDATVSGNFDEAAQSLTATASSTNTSTNCGFPVHGKTIWVDGTLTSAASVNVVNGVPVGAQTASLVGSFSWRTSDGRSGGPCEVDYSATANYTTNQAQVDGRFCGSEIHFSGPFITN
jgi:hypothetical protein